MGIVTKVKETAKKVVDGVNNGVAIASELSPQQITSLENKRNAYLSEYANKTGDEASEQVKRNLSAIAIEVYQSYLRSLKQVYRPIDVIPSEFNDNWRVRYLCVDRWVIDAEEKNLDKLVNVYEALSGENCNIALIIHRGITKCEITIGVVNTDDEQTDPAVVNTYYERLVGALNGNFPGALIRENAGGDDTFGYGIPEILKNRNEESVALVSNIATEKSEDFLSQSMEKLLDGFVPTTEEEEYTVVLLASPLNDVETRKTRLFELYTELAPFASWTTGIGVSDTRAEGSTFNLGMNASIGFSQQTSVSAGIAAPTPVGMVSAGASQSFSTSENFGVNFSRSSNVNVTLGKNETLTQTYTNYAVKHTLEEIEKQLERIEESASVGSWEFAAYILSKNTAVSTNVAHMYLALTQGDYSHLSAYALEKWNGKKEKEDAEVITKSISYLQHPCFCRKMELDEEWNAFPTLVTPATIVSGKELARSLNFPRKSVSGIPVLESVSFGREPHSLSPLNLDLRIGKGYHMRKVVPTQTIAINKDELTKHTFITGSTGSGKSTTAYKLLEMLGKDYVKFLVVEPAKGEYKLVLGKKEGVNVYVTNPNMIEYQLLRINPFAFPSDSTHVLEHLDRLIEVFNVCWPMYAAMPAILKDAIERAYISAGWDLEKSQNKYSNDLFPSFADVENEIKRVINESDYSEENKGDYIGALVTRIHSLTNGVNGLIFSNNALSDSELFDQNVIVDLSRIGSSETKSLIMGLLVIKLQEYRMRTSEPNSQLQHVTVLEEAHNILKNTHVHSSGEGSQMQSKAVEMLSNAIAEMRTYGEGFIIADQAPGLMDESVIRNTNTKIILRLPDASDRELVGKAAGLSDKQIEELGRLDVGVAAISQSGWLEPVLSKIDIVSDSELDTVFSYGVMSQKKIATRNVSDVKQSILESLIGRETKKNTKKIDLVRLKQEIIKTDLKASVKCDWIRFVENRSDKVETLKQLLHGLLDAEKVLRKPEKDEDIDSWSQEMIASLGLLEEEFNERERLLILSLIVSKQAELHQKDVEYIYALDSLSKKYPEGGVVK